MSSTAPDESSADPAPPSDDAPAGDSAGDSGPARREPGLTPRRLLLVSAVLLTLTALIGVGGVFSVRDHRAGQHIAAEDAAAVAAAKDCVVATQVPASPDLVTAEQKILDCATGDFRTQALAQSGTFLRMYQIANVHVSLDEIRAAVERHEPDGSVDVLVAFRVNVDDLQSHGRKVSSRLRAQMQFDEGAYRIAKLDTVTK